jgi:uncharacterized membrane protein
VALKIVQFITLALTTLVAGVMWGTWLGLSRSIASFSAPTFLDIGHSMIANLAPVMPALMSSAVASAAALSVLSYREGSPGFPFVTAGLGLLIVAVVITLLVEVPIDNQIRVWTPTSLPTDWRELRDRWSAFHVVRTFTSVAAMGLFLAAVIFRTGAGRARERQE